MTRRLATLVFICLLALSLGACASKSPQPDYDTASSDASDNGYEESIEDEYGIDFEEEYGEPEVVLVDDPLEDWNRFWFDFNDFVYENMLHPLAEGYRYITPDEVRRGISNFFHNLAFPVRFVNDILQLKFKAAGVEFSRFVGNTVFGLGGVAGTFNDKPGIVETDDEDFGQTLGYWGVGNGFYIVWPLLGPSTARDTVGLIADIFTDPLTYYQPVPAWVLYSATGLKHFNAMSFQLDNYEELKKAAIEPYAAMRNAYVSNREAHVKK